MTELIDRLKRISVGDHARGCQGREYTCDCGFDKDRDNALEEAIAALEAADRQAQEMREALRGIVAVADRDTVEFDRAHRALSSKPSEIAT